MATTTTAAENPKQTLGEPQSDPNPAAQTEDPRAAVTSTTPEQQPPADSTGGEDAKKEPAAGTVNAGGSVDGGSANSIEKKIKRAERFGVPVKLSEEEKRNSRAERFGTVPAPGSDATKSSEEHKRKARAERFGLVKSVSADEEAKKKSRLERFGTVTKTATVAKTDPLEEEKKKERAIRFSQSKPTTLSQTKDGAKIESKTTIVGKAGGEA